MRVTLRRLVVLISVSWNRDGTSGMLMPWIPRLSRRAGEHFGLASSMRTRLER